MKKPLVSFLVGLVFGLGLILSGMSHPDKVLGFLDIAGLWDPSLALVMAGAVGVGLVTTPWLVRRQKTLLGEAIQLPSNQHISGRLLVGSLMFGAGWGVAGFCPGPALVGLASGMQSALIFVGAMFAGFAIFRWLDNRLYQVPQ